ncbi:hypothetical protein [Thermococcus barossii]|uniref:Phosphatidate cytidylyltransferase n=1 Tax=Thermococcus barossii TaxID=54077 RepID=A0A2Z2MKN5_9EURY|nr:hypothetical protein [Thermococcus barossii]ASJ04384.1 hypothetical protein A3L01_03040 [Thermococcus barossii]
MRRLFYALPFLVFGLGLLFWEPTVARAAVVLLGWLTFALEYRYGGGSREGEELVALGVSVPLYLLLINQTLAELLAVFMFVLELAALFVKFKLKA